MEATYVDRNRKSEIRVSGPDSRPYVLGESEAEFRRLEMQSAFIRDLTEDVLKRAGLRPGMRVLDIGCGVGDVALLAGELVGPTGSVLGVDRSAASIKTAERRVAQARQHARIRLAVADLDSFVPDETFDAVVGRLVLMYLPDPAATLRRLAGHLPPGGILVFRNCRCLRSEAFPIRRSSSSVSRGSWRHSNGPASRPTWEASSSRHFSQPDCQGPR